jgi:hypothetical protein
MFVDMPARLGNLSMLHIPEIRDYILKHKFCDLGSVEGKLGRVAQMWVEPSPGKKCPKPRVQRSPLVPATGGAGATGTTPAPGASTPGASSSTGTPNTSASGKPDEPRAK